METMSSITFDNRILNPELAVSRAEHSGSRRRKEASPDPPDAPVPVDHSRSVQPHEIPSSDLASSLRQETPGFSSDLPSANGESAEATGSPPPDPLVVLELRFFDREQLRAEAEAARKAHLDIRI